jgi:hypothetical protein
MLEPSFFDDESKILYQEIPNSNLSKIKLSFSLDFDIGQSYVTSKIVDRDGVIRKLNIQAGQRGIKLQQDLCRIKKNQDDDDYGYGAFDKLPSYIYIKTFLSNNSKILILKLTVIGTSDWLLIFDEDLFMLAVKGLYDEIEILG